MEMLTHVRARNSLLDVSKSGVDAMDGSQGGVDTGGVDVSKSGVDADMVTRWSWFI